MTGEEWVDNFCKVRGLNWDKLTPAQRFQVTMLVPCSIRCFRVGGAVDVRPGEECSECGKKQDMPTAWERIPLEF